MKLINQSVEYMPQPEGIIGIYQQIERAARCCYKSESKSDGNSMAFVSKLINNKHLAMLEHATVYLSDFVHRGIKTELNKYVGTPYSKVRTFYNPDDKNIEYNVTTNYRYLLENDCIDDIQKYGCKPTRHFRRYTFRIVTSIGIGRELTRHKLLCVA